MLTVEFASAVPELFKEVVGQRDCATVVRGVEVAVFAAFTEVVGKPAKVGTAPQPAIVKVEQSLANKFLIRPNSL